MVSFDKFLFPFKNMITEYIIVNCSKYSCRLYIINICQAPRCCTSPHSTSRISSATLDPFGEFAFSDTFSHENHMALLVSQALSLIRVTNLIFKIIVALFFTVSPRCFTGWTHELCVKDKKWNYTVYIKKIVKSCICDFVLQGCERKY